MMMHITHSVSYSRQYRVLHSPYTLWATQYYTTLFNEEVSCISKTVGTKIPCA